MHLEKKEESTGLIPAAQKPHLEPITFWSSMKRTIPLIVIRAANTANSVMWVWYMGKIPDALMAASPILAFQSSGIVIFSAPLNALTTFSGKFLGAQEFDKIGPMAQQNELLSLLYSLPPIALFALSGPILQAAHQPELVQELTQKFMNILMVGVPFQFLSRSAQNLCTGINQQHVSMGIGLGGLSVTLGMGYWFMFGGAGLSPIGVPGLALAYSLQGLLSWITYRLYFFRDRYKPFQLRGCHFDKEAMKDLFSLGWPILFQNAGDVVFQLIATLVAGQLGARALKCEAVVSQWLNILMVFLFSFSQYINARISQDRGQRQYEYMNRLVAVAGGLGISLTTVAFVLFAMWPKTFAEIFLDPTLPDFKEILDQLYSYLLINVGGYTLTSAKLILTAGLRALEDTKIPMLLQLGSLICVGLPLALTLPLRTSLGLNGLGIAQVGTSLVTTGALAYRWMKRVQQAKKGETLENKWPSLFTEHTEIPTRSFSEKIWDKCHSLLFCCRRKYQAEQLDAEEGYEGVSLPSSRGYETRQ